MLSPGHWLEMSTAKFTANFPTWPEWQRAHGQSVAAAAEQRWHAGRQRVGEARAWAAASLQALETGREAEAAYQEGLPRSPEPVVVDLGNGGWYAVDPQSVGAPVAVHVSPAGMDEDLEALVQLYRAELLVSAGRVLE